MRLHQLAIEDDHYLQSYIAISRDVHAQFQILCTSKGIVFRISIVIGL